MEKYNRKSWTKSSSIQSMKRKLINAGNQLLRMQLERNLWLTDWFNAKDKR